MKETTKTLYECETCGKQHEEKRLAKTCEKQHLCNHPGFTYDIEAYESYGFSYIFITKHCKKCFFEFPEKDLDYLTNEYLEEIYEKLSI